ncbi:MAG TPA: phosphotransferase family protein [Acidimicrobiales bacterium]|jgi:aminoglycoside phosphotransferase (APT) family kinase protein
MTGAQNSIDGIDQPKVTEWFEANVDGVKGPIEFTLIAGGHSNLTFSVTDTAGQRWVLRRPPLGHVLATAHDMRREHTIISALGPTPVPVAPAIGLCMDDEVNGAPFYVMGFVDGVVVRDAETARTALDESERRRAGESIADVMAEIHAVDVDAVGLGDLGKRDGYIARQLKRWYGQFQQSNELTQRPVPLVHEVHDTLAARIPPQDDVAIVHGDYRLDNCMVASDGQIAAVLDWEICTLGDPLADAGLLMVYWNEASDSHSTLLTSPTMVSGFPSRAELLSRYASKSGRDLSAIDFYIAFGYWKLACIVEGVYARYAHGAMGKAADGFEAFSTQVVRLAEQAKQAVERLG